MMRPFNPSGTSFSSSSFLSFAILVFTSTTLQAPKPSVWMISTSLMMPVQWSARI